MRFLTICPTSDFEIINCTEPNLQQTCKKYRYYLSRIHRSFSLFRTESWALIYIFKDHCWTFISSGWILANSKDSSWTGLFVYLCRFAGFAFVDLCLTIVFNLRSFSIVRGLTNTALFCILISSFLVFSSQSQYFSQYRGWRDYKESLARADRRSRGGVFCFWTKNNGLSKYEVHLFLNS